MKTRYINVTDLNVMIDDLKSNTLYEFAVKLVKGLYRNTLNVIFRLIREIFRSKRKSMEYGCTKFNMGVGS